MAAAAAFGGNGRFAGCTATDLEQWLVSRSRCRCLIFQPQIVLCLNGSLRSLDLAAATTLDEELPLEHAGSCTSSRAIAAVGTAPLFLPGSKGPTESSSWCMSSSTATTEQFKVNPTRAPVIVYHNMFEVSTQDHPEVPHHKELTPMV